MPDRDELIQGEQFESFSNKVRGEEFAEDTFSFGSSPLEEDDVEVTGNTLGFRIDTNGSLDDEEFDAYKNSLNKSGMSFVENRGHWEGSEDLLDSNNIPDPVSVNESRTQEAIENDRERRAPVTSDVGKWASSPSHFDFPLIDTPSEFEDEMVSPYGNMKDITRAESDDELNQF